MGNKKLKNFTLWQKFNSHLRILRKLGYPKEVIARIRMDWKKVKEESRVHNLPIPVIPHSVVPIEEQLKMLGIETNINLSLVHNVVRSPRKPYFLAGVIANNILTWRATPTKQRNFVELVGRSCLTLEETIAVYIFAPSGSAHLEAMNSRNAGGRPPVIYFRGDSARLYWAYDVKDPSIDVPSCLKRIV